MHVNEATLRMAPALNAAAVTPSDSTNLDARTSALYVGATGDVSVEMANTGSAVVFAGVPAGTVLPVQVTRVNSTNTTASSIVALW